MALSGLNREINFLGSRRVAAIVSAILLVVSIASLATRGLNFGIDFTGGVLLEAGYEGAADLPDIRQRLAAGGFGDAQVQNFGTASDVLIRVLPREGNDSGQVGRDIFRLLSQGDVNVQERRVDFVGRKKVRTGTAGQERLQGHAVRHRAGRFDQHYQR